jgi:hypothetical protein
LFTHPTNWDTFKEGYHLNQTPWWYYTLDIFSLQGAIIITEKEMTALALHSARAFNAMHKAFGLINDELLQVHKVVLQKRVAPDILVASQMGVCALVESECCIYIPDAHDNVTQALHTSEREILNVAALTGDLLQE